MHLGLRIAAISMAATLLGCAGSTPTRPIDSGMVGTEGASIQAVDRSFTLQAGQSFRSPFQGQCWNLEDETPLRGENLKTSASFALQHGARSVMVTVPGRPQPLHGVLLLCETATSAYGPASRSYQIVIPPEYVDAASNGAISVVYEPVDFKANDGRNQWWYAWVLWLSDRPFAGP